ncbi:MAG: type VI secretion system baseplate subunit TssK [Myxococcota bacterium]|nr:type VI secretion system baseplate subunit TssK [Myxococcota bacterium]
MNSRSDHLAKVRWQMGQALLPQHLYAQDEALTAEMHLLNSFRGLPAFGVASMNWSDELLVDGVMAIQAADIVLPSGVVLSIPRNTKCAPFNIGVLGVNRVSLYLHYLGDSDSHKASRSGWDAGAAEVSRRIYQTVISPEQAHEGAISSFQLGVFEKQPDGAWQLTFEYIPPLMQLGTSAYLKAELNLLETALEAFSGRLSHDSVAALSVELIYGSRECLKSLQALRRMLWNLEKDIHPHPYVLFEAIVAFYVEVCMYRDATPVAARTLYEHSDISTCFQSVLGPLFEQMTVAVQKTPYQPFILKNGVYRLELPREIMQSRSVYVLVQKSGVNQEFDASRLKMAAPARLPIVYQRALMGIGLKPISRPSLGQTFGPEVSFYEVVFNDEWNAAVAEGAVSFFAQADFTDLSFYMVWN